MSDYDMLMNVMIAGAENSVDADADASLTRVEQQYRNIRNTYMKAAERRMELLIFRLYDVKHFAVRAGVEDLAAYVKDDACFNSQQAKIAALTDEAQGNALYDQAVARIREKDYAGAGELFRQAAMLGHAAAQFNYGVSLAGGEVGDADPLQACYWYWKAARNGSPKGKMNLAIAYRTGAGVKEDWHQMLYLYSAAASALEPRAVYNLGLALSRDGMTPNLESLGRHLMDAAECLEDDRIAVYVRTVSENLCGQVSQIAPVIPL